MELTVNELFNNFGSILQLTANVANPGMDRVIKEPHVQRPGLSLAGYVNREKDCRILIFGRAELEYLRTLTAELRRSRLSQVLTPNNPVVIIARGLEPPQELLKICKQYKIPVFQTKMGAMSLVTKLGVILKEALSPALSLHGTLVEVFGMGVLIQGDSSIGKSEAALGLIERKHRLISDDLVKIHKKEDLHLVGTAPDLNKYLLELRGIGIINVAHLYGAICVRKEVQIDIVVYLEEWDESHYYDRVGLERRFTELLDVKVPLYVHPIKPGRDIVLLIETTVLNHRLKGMGYHSAQEFNLKLLEAINRKKIEKES